jgi:hypothetical protein
LVTMIWNHGVFECQWEYGFLIEMPR